MLKTRLFICICASVSQSASMQINTINLSNEKCDTAALAAKFRCEKKFICEIDNCFKKFASENALKVHCKIHDKNWPWVCACGFRAVTKYRLKKHSVKHSTLKSKVCPFCFNIFKTKQLLNQHFNNVHFIVKFFNCPFNDCDYASPRKEHLHKHLQSNRHKTIIENLFEEFPDKKVADIIEYIKQEKL